MMAICALLTYIVAVFMAIVLHHSYCRKEKKVAQSTPAETASKFKRRKCLQRSTSFFPILGLERNNNYTKFYAIEDHFKSFQQVSKACQKAGLEQCGLIVGVDFSASNEWQGHKSFNKRSLHTTMADKIYNPYQKVINIMGKTLEPFDEDKLIPAFGFGDSRTTDKGVFNFNLDKSPCKGFQHVLECYNSIVTRTQLSGPTNFAPIIHKAIQIVTENKQYQILLIIADGQVTNEDETIKAIVEASNFPLSIVVIGVGDGPWHTMEDYDNLLPKRKFDNFQFVNYHAVTAKNRRPNETFALHAMMEIPDQFKTVKAMGYFENLKACC